MIRINLLGRARPRVKRRVPIGGALQVFMLLAALALPVAWMVVRYSLIQSEITRLNEEIRQKESEKRQMAQLEREIAEFENKRRLLEGRIAVIETLKRNQSGPVKMLDAVGDTVSMVDTLWLTSMEEKAGGEIEFKGQANTVNAVADFIMRLNQSGYFRSVELKESVQKAQQDGIVNFEFTLTAVFALPPVVDELINGNVHLLLVALLTGAWLGLRRGDALGDGVAGIALGAATLIKLFPAIFLVWLAVRGRWGPAIWGVTGAILLALLSVPITGTQPWVDYPLVLSHLGPPVQTDAALAPTIWLAPLLGFGVARLAVTLVGLALVVLVAIRLDERRGYAVAAVLALLMTPALWTHYLAVLVIPLVLAIACGVAPILIGSVYVLLSVGYQPAFGEAAFTVARACLTAGTLVLALGIVAAPRRRDASPDAMLAPA